MKRLIHISVLALLLSLFTHCCRFSSDSCCGESFSTPDPPSGLSNMTTSFEGTGSSLPRIEMTAKYLYSRVDIGFSLISSAYACSPPSYATNFGAFVDSILVKSETVYTDDKLEDMLYFEAPQYGSRSPFSISDFNSGVSRNLSQEGNIMYFQLVSKPIDSDFFTFSFYYYKDGAIIDSSFTQKYYISE